MTRIEQLRHVITAQNLDAVLLTHPAELYYFCGFSGSNGYLICTPNHSLFFTDRRYAQRTINEVDASFNPVVVSGNVLEYLSAELNKRNVRKLGVVEHRFTLADQAELQKQSACLTFHPVGKLVSDITSIKSADEIERLSTVLQLTESALEATILQWKENQTEAELSRELQINALQLGAESVAFEPIVAWNENAAEPHYATANQKIQANGLLLIDCGFMIDGFNSDITRMVHMGDPSERFIELYDHVCTAKNVAIETMRDGSKIADAYAAVMSYFEKHAIDQYFTHALGHGLGREVHEPPVIRGTSKDKFVEGMVVTVEPGIYIPGWGGIRIEDTVVIEPAGARVLNRLSDTYFQHG